MHPLLRGWDRSQQEPEDCSARWRVSEGPSISMHCGRWLLRPSKVKFQHHLHSPEIRPHMEWLTLSSALPSAIHVRACMLSRFSCVHLFFTLWTVACQAPLSMGFSRQEYWNGWSFPSPKHLPNPELNPSLLHLFHWQADSLPLEPPGRHYACTSMPEEIPRVTS